MFIARISPEDHQKDMILKVTIKQRLSDGTVASQFTRVNPSDWSGIDRLTFINPQQAIRIKSWVSVSFQDARERVIGL